MPAVLPDLKQNLGPFQGMPEPSEIAEVGII